MKIRAVNQNDCSKELLAKLQNTFIKYIGVPYWNAPIFKRSCQLWIKKQTEFTNNTYIVEDENDCVLIYIFSESFFVSGFKYGIDYCERFQFQHVNLWEEVPVLKKLKEVLDFSVIDEVDLPYLTMDNYFDVGAFDSDMTIFEFKRFVKDLKLNFNPHIFGTKSKLYEVNALDCSNDFFPANEGHVLNIFINAIKSHGWERFQYLQSVGDNWIEPELYDMILLFHSNLYQDNIKSGLVCIKVDEEEVAVLTWKMIKDKKIGFLEEVIVDKSDKYKHLSLVNVATIHAINQLAIRNCKTIYMGMNFSNTGDYKSIYSPNYLPVRLNAPFSNDLSEVHNKLMNIGG